MIASIRRVFHLHFTVGKQHQFMMHAVILLYTVVFWMIDINDFILMLNN